MTSIIAENLALASLALILVLALRRPVAELFGAGWAYALWLLPALRLVAPPLPDFTTSMLPPLTTVIGLSGDLAASVPPQGGSGQWMPMLLVAWAAGAAVFLVWQWLAYRRFLTRLSLSASSAGAHRGLPLVASAAVDGPIALGLLDRRIVVPADFLLRYSPAERRLAVEHEWVHHRRGDIWWNLAAILFLAANWFNPLAWAAFRYFRTDQELACDAAVAAAASPEERHDYARALVKSASRPGLIAACPLNHADQLKRRLKMLKSHRKSRLRSAGGMLALGAAIAVTAAAGTPSMAQEQSEKGKQRTESFVIMERVSGDRTAPPREFTIRRGENGQIVAPEGCTGGSTPALNVDERDGDRRTRVILCGQGEQNAAQQLEALQRARARIAEGQNRPAADHRDRVLEAIDREIARLRGR